MYEKAKESLSIASLKQDVFSKSFVFFEKLNQELQIAADELETYESKNDERVGISFKNVNKNESWIQFGGDVLIFSLHSNIFSFDEEHPMIKSKYIKEDKTRAYFCMIEVFNFLSDSVEYNRMGDVGELLARIFVNNEGNFFIEGMGTIGNMYSDLANQKFDENSLKAVIEYLLVSTLQYDLWAPDFQQVRFIPLANIVQQNGNSPRVTTKRLGFQIENKLEE